VRAGFLLGFCELSGNLVTALYLLLVRRCISQGLLKLLDPMPLVSRSNAAPVSVKSHTSNNGGTSKQAVRKRNHIKRPSASGHRPC
jgi:hypothetical protein